MATLSESAKAYTAAKTKNIADLDIVDTSAPIEVRKGKDKDGHDYEFNVIVVNAEDHRVPDMVLANLKTILEKRPNLKQFQVSKSGTGMNTRYTVIPIA
jgi:hypothetical protein